jgi:two-component sensor histidine kinase
VSLIATRRLRLLADRRAPAAVRSAIRDVLDSTALADLADDVMLLASELVTNALRHGGGGRVRVELNDGDACRIIVRDEGPGMAGTIDGLGLTLVRRLAVDGLGGTVEVDSSTRGTTVKLTFPSAVEADR